MTDDACKVLMIFPRFNADSFWSYRATCELSGARYPAAPLVLTERALAEMYVQGVSTRKVKAINEELRGHSFLPSIFSMSLIC